MTFLKIVCPDCRKPLLTIEAEGTTPLRIIREGTVNIRCPNCMAWKNVVEQLDVFLPEHKPDPGEPHA